MWEVADQDRQRALQLLEERIFCTNDVASLMAWRPSPGSVDAAALSHALVWSVLDPAKMHCLALLRHWLPGCESNPFKWELCGWGVRSGYGAPSTALRIRSCFVFMLFFVSCAYAPFCRVALASRLIRLILAAASSRRSSAFSEATTCVE